MPIRAAIPSSPPPSLARRTSAVACADIVGYTVMLSTDPQATYASWMRLLAEVVRPLAGQHGCRFLKSTGDGVIAEFPSASAALAWALDVQRRVSAEDLPDAPPIAFRIGIELGDVVEAGTDIHGIAVRIAARLQEHAPPGGVALSAAMRRALPPRTDLQDIGPILLRDISDPVQVCVIVPALPPRLPRRAPRDGRPAIAVMPFEATAAQDADRYFADGVIDDIVRSLGALQDLNVIARAATLGWGHGRHDPRVVGRVLGVRYAISGSLARRGGGLRLAAALHETDEGEEIWRDRFDVADHELFAVQEEIVRRAVAGIAPTIQAADLRRALRKRPDSLTAYDHTLRALHALDGLQRDRFAEAEHHLEAAMREDAGYALPRAWAAHWHSLAVGQAWSRDTAAHLAQVQELAGRAIQLDPRTAQGHAISGHYRAYHLRDPQSALPFLDRAVQVGPSHAVAWALRSASLSYLGRGPEALADAEHAFALSPRGADRYYFQFFVGLAQHVSGDHAAAVGSFRRSLVDNPGYTASHRFLIAALDAVGAQEAANATAAQLMACEPDFRVTRYADERQPLKDPALAAQLLGALRRAGVPP
jgi:adenylate cyclase